MAVLRDEQVLGLQVPVDDALLVGRRESFRGLERVIDGLPLRDRARVELAPQRLAFEKLRHGVGDAVLRSEIEDRKDVRMRQRRDRQSLALEPRQGIRIRRERLRQNLDRHLALQLRIPRPIHLSHPARARGARRSRRTRGACRPPASLALPRRASGTAGSCAADRSWGRSSASRARGNTGSSAAARAGRAPSRARRRGCRSATSWC